MRRRSAGRDELPEDEADLVFFIDHSMGRVIVAGALRAQGCRVELHHSHFAESAKDEDWLPEVGRRGWIIISKDYGIATNEVERLAIFESGARTFLLSRSDLTGDQMANALVTGLRRIRNIARSQPAPFIARVSPSGEVHVLVKLRQEWRRSRRRGRASTS